MGHNQQLLGTKFNELSAIVASHTYRKNIISIKHVLIQMINMLEINTSCGISQDIKLLFWFV